MTCTKAGVALESAAARARWEPGAGLGLIVADLIAEPMDLRHPPSPGGLLPLNSLQMTTGGNACNVGIAMARIRFIRVAVEPMMFLLAGA